VDKITNLDLAQALKLISVNFSIEVPADYPVLIYSQLKDWSKEDLLVATNKFLSEPRRKLFPTLGEWREALGIPSDWQIANARKTQSLQKFVDAVDKFLSSKWYEKEDKEALYAEIGNLGLRTLKHLGGIEEIHWSIHRDDYTRSLSTVMKELEIIWSDLYTSENVLEQVAISDRSNRRGLISLKEVMRKFGDRKNQELLPTAENKEGV